MEGRPEFELENLQSMQAWIVGKVLNLTEIGEVVLNGLEWRKSEIDNVDFDDDSERERDWTLNLAVEVTRRGRERGKEGYFQ